MKIDNKKYVNILMLGFFVAVTVILSPFSAYAMDVRLKNQPQGELPYDANDDLRQAIGKNEVESVKRALVLGAEPRGGLACAIALQGTDTAMLDPMMAVLDKEALSAFDNNGKTLFHLAARKGNIRAAEKLLDKGAEIDALDSAGATPLMAAIYSKQAAMVQWLLENAADINKKVTIDAWEFPILRWTEELAKKDKSYNAVLICLKAFQAAQNMDRFDKPASERPSVHGNNNNNKPATGSKAPKLSAETSFFKNPFVYGLLGVVVASLLYKFFKSTKVSYKK